jgi:hypothetical protein
VNHWAQQPGDSETMGSSAFGTESKYRPHDFNNDSLAVSGKFSEQRLKFPKSRSEMNFS